MKLQVVLVLALLATAALALSAEPKEQGSLHPVKVLQSGSNGACDCNPSDENCGCKPKWQVPEIKEEKACPCSDEEKAQAECECLKKQANEHPLDKKEHYLPPNNVVEGDEQNSNDAATSAQATREARLNAISDTKERELARQITEHRCACAAQEGPCPCRKQETIAPEVQENGGTQKPELRENTQTQSNEFDEPAKAYKCVYPKTEEERQSLIEQGAEVAEDSAESETDSSKSTTSTTKVGGDKCGKGGVLIVITNKNHLIHGDDDESSSASSASDSTASGSDESDSGSDSGSDSA